MSELDGRYEALGRAIYRAMQANPKDPGFGGDDAHEKMLAGLAGIKPFIESQLSQAKKDNANATILDAESRQDLVDHLNDEIKWIDVALDRFGWLDKRRKVNAMDEKEVPSKG